MRTHLVTFTTAALLVFAGQNARGQCCGDCNGDGTVVINELITAVNNALGGGCQELDCPGELTQCNSNLTTCNAGLGTCNGILTTCQTARDQCVNIDLPSCKTVRNQCVNTDLPSCQTTLSSTQKGLTQCEADRDRCCSQCDGQLFPATGQTTCWDTTGSVIACIGTGQDGEFRTGGALAYVDNGDGTVTDLNTHLIWEVKDDSGSVHDTDNSYTWEAAFAFVRGLNTQPSCFTGHCDWRLPNVKELQSIINYQTDVPPVSAAFNHDCSSGCAAPACSCTRSIVPETNYWTSTSVHRSPNFAWFVNFYDGNTSANTKATAFSVRAVRGGL